LILPTRRVVRHPAAMAGVAPRAGPQNFPMFFGQNAMMPTSFLAVAMDAEALIDELEWLSNSTIVALIVAGLVIFVCRKAASKREKVPSGMANAFEALVDGLYSGVESIVGRHMVAKVFPLLATLFIFILIANWFGLMPGVGTIGFGAERGPALAVEKIDLPILRPATADLNMTLAMAVVFFVLWVWWSFKELGLFGFIHHTFGPKGGLKGLMALALMPIFFFVGVIEVVSIAFRPISLSLRLYGNILAGENLLHAMLFLGDDLGLPKWLAYASSVIFPLPFYFLELLVGLLQALVFTLLCAVYIQLSTAHEEEEGHGQHGQHDKAHAAEGAH